MSKIDLIRVFESKTAVEAMNFLKQWESDTGCKVIDLPIDINTQIRDFILSLITPATKDEIDTQDMGCVKGQKGESSKSLLSEDNIAFVELIECMKSYDDAEFKALEDEDTDEEGEGQKAPTSFFGRFFKGGWSREKKTGAGTGTRKGNRNAEDSKSKYERNMEELDKFIKRTEMVVEKFITSGERRSSLDTDTKKHVVYTRHALGDTEVVSFRDDNNRLFLFDLKRGCFVMRTKEDTRLLDYICNSEDMRNELDFSIKDDDGKIRHQNVSDYLLSIFLRNKILKDYDSNFKYNTLMEGEGEYVINHINGDVLDNTDKNLEIVTKKENNLHAAAMKEINHYFPYVVSSREYQRGEKSFRQLTYTKTYRQGINCYQIWNWNKGRGNTLKVHREKNGVYQYSLDKSEVTNLLRSVGFSL